MTSLRTRFRSLLYVPANRNDFIQKAHSFGADAIILDLEDSVPSDQKLAARNNLIQSIAQLSSNDTPVFVRINASPEHMLADAKAAFLAGAFGLYVPKANRETLLEINNNLSVWETENDRSAIKLVALIEDPDGVLNAQKIAKCPRVWALTVGSEDLALSLGASPTKEVLSMPKQIVHYAAKAAGLYSFGLFRSISNYTDIKGIGDAGQEAKEYGFDGATCVHPNAITVLNVAFGASQEEISWAKKLLKIAGKNDCGPFVFDDKMIDAPILARAKKILDNG